MNIIETKDLCYTYQDNVPALDHISIEIEKGKFTGILGGNGAGKSTLFLNLNGVLVPKSGEVFFDGERVDYSKKSIAAMRRKVGIVFQDPNDQLFSSSVTKDISFGAVNLGLPEDEVKRRVSEAIEQTGIASYAEKPTHALSFGQKKRVSIAGVLVMQPEVIILDEPTAGLDPSGVSEILKLLEQIKRERNISVVVATHDIDIVPLYCDHVYVFDHGRAVMSGEPREIFERAAELRDYSLRLPRIAHLMQILNHKDGLPTDSSAGTISTARACLKGLMNKGGDMA